MAKVKKIFKYLKNIIIIMQVAGKNELIELTKQEETVILHGLLSATMWQTNTANAVK